MRPLRERLNAKLNLRSANARLRKSVSAGSRKLPIDNARLKRSVHSPKLHVSSKSARPRNKLKLLPPSKQNTKSNAM